MVTSEQTNPYMDEQESQDGRAARARVRRIVRRKVRVYPAEAAQEAAVTPTNPSGEREAAEQRRRTRRALAARDVERTREQEQERSELIEREAAEVAAAAVRDASREEMPATGAAGVVPEPVMVRRQVVVRRKVRRRREPQQQDLAGEPLSVEIQDIEVPQQTPAHKGFWGSGDAPETGDVEPVVAGQPAAPADASAPVFPHRAPISVPSLDVAPSGAVNPVQPVGDALSEEELAAETPDYSPDYDDPLAWDDYFREEDGRSDVQTVDDPYDWNDEEDAQLPGGFDPSEHLSRKQPELVAYRYRRSRFSSFWVFYLLLVVVLAGFASFVWAYTYDSLERYEESQPEVFMEHFLNDLKQSGRAAQKRKEECFGQQLAAYESVERVSELFQEGLGKQDYRYEANGVIDTSAPSYVVYVDERPYLALHLASGDSYTRLGLLSITEWKVDHAVLLGGELPEDAADHVDTGYAYDISVADSSTVTMNGQELTSADLTEGSVVLPGLEYAEQFVDVPDAITYHVEGLVCDPVVEAKDFEGNPVELNRAGYSYAAASLSTPNREPGELPVDVLQFAENYSLLLTDDLGGDNHGAYQILSYLIPGSELYNYINTFVNGVDITFVAGHSMNGFTEESVTNCVMYNDRLFSCDVRFIKHIGIGGGTRTDEFNNTMIFAYVDDMSVVDAPGWYLINMQSITE